MLPTLEENGGVRVGDCRAGRLPGDQLNGSAAVWGPRES